jgi:hypothetical protein
MTENTGKRSDYRREPTAAASVVFMLLCIAVVLAGCNSGTHASTVDPHLAQTETPTKTTGNFVLYVSDQSFKLDEVDITIRVDGKVAVSDLFAVGNQHNWKQYRFQLDPGAHRLTAASRIGNARVARTFRVEQKLYGVVDYWYSPGNPGGERRLTYRQSREPLSFA